VFRGGVYNRVFVFKEVASQKEIGYAVCFISDNILQFAHSFYDLSYFEQNLGARMMLEAIIWAKKSLKQYVYLGTCYEKGALYKIEFKGVEFFNGFTWSKNLEELKALVQGEEGQGYLFRNKEYLNRYYQGDILNLLNNFGVRVNFGD
ncbi:MAG: hypothetical protein M1514_01090, partial [Patescibacteria group bacterium]|nr:hypothetical protein [Patescibacteria group bacterium]